MKRLQILTVAAAVVLLSVAAAYASGGGEGHSLPWGNFLARVANFVIVGAIIWKLAGKKIGELFRGRQEQIRHDLDDLDVRRKEAEAKLREVEKSIANIAEEKQAILDEAARQGEQLKAAIVEEAERKAEQIKAQAGFAIETERKAALESIRNEVADMVVATAEEMLRKKLKKKDHQKLVDDYLTKVVLN